MPDNRRLNRTLWQAAEARLTRHSKAFSHTPAQELLARQHGSKPWPGAEAQAFAQGYGIKIGTSVQHDASTLECIMIILSSEADR